MEVAENTDSFIRLIDRKPICDKTKDQKNHYFKNTKGHSDDNKPNVYKNIDFSYSIFENSYFRNAVFEDCVFLGCKFYGSNFKGCEFISCRFDYSLFINTIIPSKELIANLPKQHNVRADLLQNLRSNAISQCEYRDEKLFILYEIEATKCHYKAAALKEDSYYRNKYPTFFNTIEFNLKRFFLWFDGLTWGHGEKPLKAVFFLFLCLSGISAINATIDNNLNFIKFFEYLYHSIFLLLDISQPESTVVFPMWFILIVAILRYLYLGLLVAVIYRRISHR